MYVDHLDLSIVDFTGIGGPPPPHKFDGRTMLSRLCSPQTRWLIRNMGNYRFVLPPFFLHGIFQFSMLHNIWKKYPVRQPFEANKRWIPCQPWLSAHGTHVWRHTATPLSVLKLLFSPSLFCNTWIVSHCTLFLSHILVVFCCFPADGQACYRL